MDNGPVANGFVSPRFPRASAYSPAWIRAGLSGGANVLWLAEWLSEAMDLRPEMRVLDLGCGRAQSSIFLHREFGVQVWAVDLWFSADENWQRIRDAGAEAGVFPLRADARALPFAASCFDAIVSLDSFFYYGTDDLYLANVARFLKPGGQIGIAGAGLMRELEDDVPEHLRAWWDPSLWCLHSAPWWRRHWARTGIVDVEIADVLVDGWRHWLAWQRTVAPDNTVEINAVEADAGRALGYVRTVARRTAVPLDPPITSIATRYENRPLTTEAALTQIFRGAGEAHHRAFAHVNGDDPQWPEWYAAHLAPGMRDILGQEIDVARLASDLRQVDEEHRATAGDQAWPAYYAAWFLKRMAGGAS